MQKKQPGGCLFVFYIYEKSCWFTVFWFLKNTHQHIWNTTVDYLLRKQKTAENGGLGFLF